MVPAPARAVVLDLDGTLLDTESLVVEVSNKVLSRYGKSLTLDAQHAGFGKRPLEAWQAVADLLGVDVPAQQLFDESEPLLREMWSEARMLPGARRLVAHLVACGVPLALATSTSRDTLQRKLSGHPELADGVFTVIKCGDEVKNGKPHPECFLAAAQGLGVDPAECLAIEDAPSGVQSAVAAGMRVVAVPSVNDVSRYPTPQPDARSGCVQVIPSLLEFRPETYGLPPFTDLLVGGAAMPLLPPLRLSGPVVKGFGRGSKELGIRTANLGAESLSGSLAEAVTGIFLGWASLQQGDGAPHHDGTGSSSGRGGLEQPGAGQGSRGGNGGQQQQLQRRSVYKMVVSVGWNPFYGNKEKTAEPWLLHEFGQDFYGKELRLLICGYIRPEADFVSLEALKARIFQDADVARQALEDPMLQALRDDPFLHSSTAEYS